MWYTTEKEAEEACKWKEKRYGIKFYVLKETTRLGKETKETIIYWAQRKENNE